MRTNKIINLFTLLLTFSLLAFNGSCSERNETVSCFPNSVISVQLNLSLASYYKLNTPGSWVYTIGEVGTGTRGLIIYSYSSNGSLAFMIYDRNAPHICPDTNTTLEVQNGTKIICPKDGAEWFLTTGQPLNATAKTGLKTYRYYSYDPGTNILSINN